MGTYIIGGILVIVVVAIIANMFKRKKEGKGMSCDCSGGCGGCSSGSCSGHE